MAKQSWKPGNMLYPIPAVMVSCGDMENSNILTVLVPSSYANKSILSSSFLPNGIL